MTASRAWPVFVLAVLLGAAPRLAAAQPHRASAPPENGHLERGAGSSVVVKETPRAREGLSVGSVGQALVSERPLGPRFAEPRAAAAQQPQDDVSTDEFTRGALVGGGVGLAAGAFIGAVLGGDGNSRWATALPVAAAGLAVGTPTGVYVYTGRSSRYLWGTAGAAGAVAAGTVLYFVEAR
jgi:hypothetical protein